MIRRGLLLVVIAALGAPAPVCAHEIKVFASRLVLPSAGEKTTIYLAWGHRIPVDDLVEGKSIARYEAIGPSGVAQALKMDELSLQANALEIKEAGITQLVVDRKVTVYTHVIDAEGNKLLKRGPKSAVKEGKIESALRSVQCGKALVLAGPANIPPVKAVGQAIEIVPVDGPADWRNGSVLRFQVMLQGKPLPTATVVATYVGFRPENAWCYSTYTAKDGIAQVRMTQPGTWLLKINTRVDATAAELDQYDFTSYTATLALEIRP